MIIDLVWHESLDYYSHRAINNHVSNLRHKLKVTPETPDYIRSVHRLCKNILHQLLLLTGIQQGKQLFTNLLAVLI